ncbi:unnamed protein product, partial [Symbiodinium microadriaticum]
ELRPSAYPQTAPRGRRRPPRSLHAHRPDAAVPFTTPSPARAAAPRARSLPPPVGLVLAGLSIVGSGTRGPAGA